MNQFAIFYTLALFYLLFASAQAEPGEVLCEIQEATFQSHAKRAAPIVLSGGHLYLYKLHDVDAGPAKWYAVGDGKDRLSDKFRIFANGINTNITRHSITVREPSRTIKLLFEEGDNVFDILRNSSSSSGISRELNEKLSLQTEKK